MPAELSAYERQRLKNIAENRKVLEQLGIFKPFKPEKSKVFQKPVKRKRPKESTPRKSRKVDDVNVQDQGSSYALGRRKSRRLQGQTAPSKADVDAELSKADEDADYKPKAIKRENTFGAIPGVEVGTHWDMRIECSRDGIHRPTVAGIHGNELEGCYSVAMSGGYEDDLDLGECFTFTGEGGRDLKGTKTNPKNLRTAPQSKDQTLTRGNMALSKNVENRRPVRVIRGFKSDSAFAPDEGYRYDGLYTVEKYWFTTGLSGYGVYKFAFRRCKDQAPPPWEIRDNGENGSQDGAESGYGSQVDQNKEENNNDNDSDTCSDLSSSGSPTKPQDDNPEDGSTETADEKKNESSSEAEND